MVGEPCHQPLKPLVKADARLPARGLAEGAGVGHVPELVALDLIHAHVARDLLLFQSMQRGSDEVEPVAEDYPFFADAKFDRPGYPKLHFVEHRYADDPTNWWVPNRAAVEAMLRSAGFDVLERAEHEVFLCRRREIEHGPDGPYAVYPARGERR